MDTVRIKHFYQTLKSEAFRESWRFLNRRRLKTWVLNGDSSVPNLTMVQTPDSRWHLSAEASLPKLIFGHNAKLPTQEEIDVALDLIGKYVELHSELEFDPWTATVVRVDYAKDIQMTESQAWDTIRLLSKKRLPRMEKLYYDDATLYFKAKSRSIRIYPKYQEVLKRRAYSNDAAEFARGVLRFEHSINSNYAVNSTVKKFALADKTANSLLKIDISECSVSYIMEQLGFDRHTSKSATRLEKLLDCFTTRRAITLLGFLKFVEERGINLYKDGSLGIKKHSYQRDVRDCRKAGVWSLE